MPPGAADLRGTGDTLSNEGSTKPTTRRPAHPLPAAVHAQAALEAEIFGKHVLSPTTTTGQSPTSSPELPLPVRSRVEPRGRVALRLRLLTVVFCVTAVAAGRGCPGQRGRRGGRGCGRW